MLSATNQRGVQTARPAGLPANSEDTGSILVRGRFHMLQSNKGRVPQLEVPGAAERPSRAKIQIKEIYHFLKVGFLTKARVKSTTDIMGENLAALQHMA